VTDGTSFWVVDGTKLKDFTYALSGSSLGSWAIDPVNAHPTRITINPNNVSDVRIVDSSTLKVYDDAVAAGRTSGSQNAASTFAPAAGNTNPQGIADPPPADRLPSPAASPVALPQQAGAAFNAPGSGGTPALAGLDAVFARLGRESFPRQGGPAVALLGPNPHALAGQPACSRRTARGHPARFPADRSRWASRPPSPRATVRACPSFAAVWACRTPAVPAREVWRPRRRTACLRGWAR
jgi:hypothetical protein